MLFKTTVLGGNGGIGFFSSKNGLIFDVVSQQGSRATHFVRDGCNYTMQFNNIIFDTSSIIVEGLIIDNSTRSGGNISLRLSPQSAETEIVDAQEVVV